MFWLIVGVLAAQDAHFELPRTLGEEAQTQQDAVLQDATLAGEEASARARSDVGGLQEVRRKQAQRKAARRKTLEVTHADPDGLDLDTVGSPLDRELLQLRKQRAVALHNGDLTAMDRLDRRMAAVKQARQQEVYVPRVTQQAARQGPQTLLDQRVTALEEQRKAAQGDALRDVDDRLREARLHAQAWLRPQQDVWLNAEVSPSMLSLQDRIAALKRRRRELRNWADNEQRAAVDRELALLRRVADTASDGITSRVTQCGVMFGHLPLLSDAAARSGMLGRSDGLPGGTAGKLSLGVNPCLAQAEMVPPLAEDVERKRQRLRETRWDWSNIHEKRALEEELRVLDNGGVP